MQYIRKQIEEFGLLETIRRINPDVARSILSGVRQPTKKMESFTPPGVEPDEGYYLATTFQGPWSDGMYLRGNFSMRTYPVYKLTVSTSFVNFDPRECHYPPECEQDHHGPDCDGAWECEDGCDDSCDSCNHGTDYCLPHGEYH